MKLCSTCNAGCCRRYRIALTGYDILKIKNNVKLDYDSFITLIKIDDDERIEYHRKNAALFKFTNDGCTDYYMFSLKMEDSKLFYGAEKCIFLQEWAGENFDEKTAEGLISRCGIYGARPNTCAAYPAKFDKSGFIGVYFDPTNKTDEKSSSYNLCSRTLVEGDLEGSKEEMIDILVNKQYELDFFKMIAFHWNNSPKSQGEFLDFIEEIYQNRLSSESELKMMQSVQD